MVTIIPTLNVNIKMMIIGPGGTALIQPLAPHHWKAKSTSWGPTHSGSCGVLCANLVSLAVLPAWSSRKGVCPFRANLEDALSTGIWQPGTKQRFSTSCGRRYGSWSSDKPRKTSSPESPGATDGRSVRLPEEQQIDHHQRWAGGQAKAQGLLGTQRVHCLPRDHMFVELGQLGLIWNKTIGAS